MIVYEVNCFIDKAIEDDFMKWLPTHIQAVLAVEGFVSSETLLIADDDTLAMQPNSSGVSIRYILETREALDNYFNTHAERLRKEGKDRFADNFSAYRRVLLMSG